MSIRRDFRGALTSKGFKGALFTALLITPAAPIFAQANTVSEDARTGDVVYTMTRKGKEIGAHSMRFTPLEDGRLQVDVAIFIKVKFGFITVYRYEHRNQEIWSAGGEELLAIRTQTNNNGKDVTAAGSRTGDIFTMVDETGRNYEIAGDVYPTSYWHPGLLQDGVNVLNTQKGVLSEVDFERRADGALKLPQGAQVETAEYEAKGELNRIYVDYTQEGKCWVGLDFFPPNQDVRIDYELQSFFARPRADLRDHPILGPCVGKPKSPQAASIEPQGDGRS